MFQQCFKYSVYYENSIIFYVSLLTGLVVEDVLTRLLSMSYYLK